MTLIDQISKYEAAYFSPFPVLFRDKQPAVQWKSFQNRRPTSAEIQSWFSVGAKTNVGIVTGVVSGIVVLDVDGDEGKASLAALGELPSTPTVRTGNGCHLYFRHPGFSVGNSVRLMPGLDIRGDGGYVVAPPSVHSNGSPYEWIVSLESEELAELPESVVALIQRDGDTTEEPSLGDPKWRTELAGTELVSRACRPEVERLLGQLAQAREGKRNDTLNRVAFAFGQISAGGGIDGDWAKETLRSVSQSTGLDGAEINNTIESGFEAGTKKPRDNVQAEFEILDKPVEAMARPLCLINGNAYGATWLPIAPPGDPDGKGGRTELVVFTKDREFFCLADIKGSRPLEDLPFRVELASEPKANRLLSPSGFRAYMNRESPSPQEVFAQVRETVDRFVSFENSLADQKTMSEFVSCWIIGTYFLDAFDVTGYLWPTGERGSGKTQLLNVVTSMALLGKTTTAGSSFASIRDEAHYGATLAFDDCEDLKNMDNSKRELLLAGNMRGTIINRKEPAGKNEWRTLSINNFAPRLFSSIGLPDAVLGSRTISIPLITSLDTQKTRRSPLRSDDWSIDQQKIIDGLWSVSVDHLPRLRDCDQLASRQSALVAREHDIWRMPLAVAYWLQHDHGVEGLWHRLEQLSTSYRKLQSENEEPDLSALVVQAAHELIRQKGDDISVPTKLIANEVRRLEEVDEDFIFDQANGAQTQRVGRMLGRLGFDKGGHGKRRSWRLCISKVDAIAKARGIPLDNPTNLAKAA